MYESQFNSNDDLPLNKIIKIHIATIVVRAIFYENNKYYPQVFLDDFFIMIELIFLKQLMLIRQANQKSVMFVHDLLMMSINLSDIVILSIKGADYHRIISGISKG